MSDIRVAVNSSPIRVAIGPVVSVGTGGGGGSVGHDHYGALISPCAVDGTATTITLIDAQGDPIGDPLPISFAVGHKVFFADGMWTVTSSGPWTAVDMNGGELIQSTSTGESYSARNEAAPGNQIDPDSPATSIARVVDIVAPDPFDYPALAPSVPVVLSGDDDCFTGTGDTLTLAAVPGILVRNDSLGSPIGGKSDDTLVYLGNPNYPLDANNVVIICSGSHEGAYKLAGGKVGDTATKLTDDDSVQGVPWSRLGHNRLIKVAEGPRGQRLAVVFESDDQTIHSAREFAWLTGSDITSPDTIDVTVTHGKGEHDEVTIALPGIGNFADGAADAGKALLVDGTGTAWELGDVVTSDALDAYELAGSAASAVALHSADTDPHGDRAYAQSLFAANDALVYKGVIDCSANPNYPAANAGETYRVSVAGKIGGSSGLGVEVGDMAICVADSTSAGTHAAVGASWDVLQLNIDGAVTGPASATNNRIAVFNGTSGKAITDGGVTIASLVPTSRTVAGHALSADVAIAFSDLTGTAAASQLPGGAGWQMVANTTVSNGGSGVASVQVTGLSAHRQLRVLIFGSHTGASIATLGIRFNSDSGANYNNASSTGATAINVANALPGTGTASTYGAARFDIFNIAAKEKKVMGVVQGANNSNGSTVVSAWLNTSALISTLDVFTGSGNIADGTRVIVEGLA